MTPKDVYKTNIVILLGFALIGFWKVWLWCYILATLVALATVLHYNTAKHIAQVWIIVGKKIGNINAKILLTVFYFFFLLPIAWLKKLMGSKESMPTKSNWKTANKAIDFTTPF